MKLKIIIALLASCSILAQQKTNVKSLEAFIAELKARHNKDSIALDSYLKANNLPRVIKADSALIVANRINEFGMIEYLTTNNVNAAKTSNTQKLQQGGSLGLSLDGTGIVIGVWDGGTVRQTHQEFTNTGASRITVGEAVATNWHATHVAGTIIAGGVAASAKGMSPKGNIKSYDFNNDLAEMSNEVLDSDLKLSNHSYGHVAGWYWNGTAWQWSNTNTATLGQKEDFFFGYYDSTAKDYDNLCYFAPYYTHVKSAGNDNGNGSGSGSPYPNDGPYDCLPTSANAKNIIAVGAVNDIVNGYTQPSDVQIASFSSTGPSDDGRIKPDLVANGVSLLSSNNTADNLYTNSSGTSMAAPTVTGSIALLNQHYKNLFGGSSDMTSATIKALLINTAEESGSNPGPDYIFGWGLMNTEKAAVAITNSKKETVLMKEQLLANNETYILKAISKGTEPIKATVVWTDPAGTPPNNLNTVLDNPTKMLVNDLDFKITANSNTYYPWSLSAANPSNAATNNAKNNTDNVEGVSVGYLAAGTVVSLTVNHSGNLTYGHQWFSMVTKGLMSNDNFADAVTINPSQYTSPLGFYTTEIGTADGGNYTCTMVTPKNNVWFKFVATGSDQSLFVLADGANGSLQKPILSVWKNASTLIACYQATNTNKAFLHLTDLEAGKTYYIAVDNSTVNEAGSFTLFANDSTLQTLTSTSTLEPGTIRYNNSLQKFQGWNGTQWLNFN